MSIHIEPLKLPLSDNPEDYVGKIRLRYYQAQLRRCDHPRILLKAPTGSGKTLAYLIRAIESGEIKPRFGTTVIIYPTNSLIWDQARSLCELVRKLGKKANVTIESKDGLIWNKENKNADVNLYVLNGETLGALAQESRSSEGKALVEQLRDDQTDTRIILSNPEILYYMFLYRFAQNEELLESIFNRNPPNLLIFDEFHLYHGYTLATITYMLSYMKDYFDQIIFSSATPIDVESIIHKKCQRIVAEPSDKGDIVKHNMDLTLESIGGILGSKEIPIIRQLVRSVLEKNENTTQDVKVLIIVNSVLTCTKIIETLEGDYPDQVTAIHGLIPSHSRPRNISEFKPIVVGTSAIEVGIDFDTAALIFESHNSSSFLQRIGRGARHKNCIATALIPALNFFSFNKALPNGITVKHSTIETCARQFLPRLPSYSSFPSSPQAAPIMTAILLNWTMQRPAGRRQLNFGQIITQTKLQITRDYFKIPEEINFSKEELSELCEKAPKYGIRKMAQKMSCRNSIDSIPAVFKSSTGNSAQFDYLSLNDLTRVNFNVITKDELTRKGIKIPWRMKLVEKFLQINGIRHNYEKVRLSFEQGRFEKTPEPLIHFKVVADDHNVEDQLERILRLQPAYLLIRKEDWRLPGFFTIHGDFLVVGGDSYLAWFLSNQYIT